MDQRVIKSDRFTEQVIEIKHSSGLMMQLCPMEGFSGTYALFSANVGSVDTGFKTQYDDDFVDVPEGIAHFLEHKMFENPEGDAFSLYGKTGASANAYTSFGRTAYLFSCTENFEQSLEILLHMVRTPYFTEESVKKEQGIIGQEIRMGDDNPDWRVLFNLLDGLYTNHPVKIDIAGSVESIAEIDADLLYRCHRTFYNLSNMVLTIAGDFTVESVLKIVDKVVKPDEKPVSVEHKEVSEPEQINKPYAEQKLSVASPMFMLGFKGVSKGNTENFKAQILDEMLCEMVAGESTAFYSKLYDTGLINSAFSSEVMAGRDYICTMFSGESRDPKKVAEMLKDEIRTLQKNGLDKELFELIKRATYGRYIGAFARIEAVASLMASTYFAGIDNVFSILDIVADVTYEQMQERLMVALDTEKASLSVIMPQDA